eukprot:6195673-Pleurochrysis_carterae.AAC.2
MNKLSPTTFRDDAENPECCHEDRGDLRNGDLLTELHSAANRESSISSSSDTLGAAVQSLDPSTHSGRRLHTEVHIDEEDDTNVTAVTETCTKLALKRVEPGTIRAQRRNAVPKACRARSTGVITSGLKLEYTGSRLMHAAMERRSAVTVALTLVG